MRGDCTESVEMLDPVEQSPRVWGRFGNLPFFLVAIRAIPTHVGVLYATAATLLRPGQSPRVWGRLVNCFLLRLCLERSPLVWGRRWLGFRTSHWLGAIPTHVGWICGVMCGIILVGDNPHVCGGDLRFRAHP